MPRSSNAQAAVNLYQRLREQQQWTAATAWHGIAKLLLTCQIWRGRWLRFHDVVVHREANDFRLSRGELPNTCLRRAEDLTSYLASQLDIPRSELCANIGLYWREPNIRRLQPHNLVGHAFRSLIVASLEAFGFPELTYNEEVSPYDLFPGHRFETRSKEPKIDIVAYKRTQIVALISTRWRFRHDRVDLVDEAMAYAPAARRQNSQCRMYAVVGEFAPNRLCKILAPVRRRIRTAPSMPPSTSLLSY